MVSDCAKALIKLAHTGLRCPSSPDVFPLGHDLAKGYALALFGRLRQAKREFEQAKPGREKLQQNIRTDSAQVAQAQRRIAACATVVHHWPEVGRPCLAAAPVQCVAHPASLAACGLDTPDIERG